MIVSHHGMSTGSTGEISIIMEIKPEINKNKKISDRIKSGKRVNAIKYREAIIELAGKIQDERILRRIYRFVLYLYTQETDG